MALGKNLTIYKAENGNVLILDNNLPPNVLVSFPTGTPVELQETLVTMKLGGVASENISLTVEQVDFVQLWNQAPTPFTGAITNDLMVLMQDFLANPAAVGGGGATESTQQQILDENIAQTNFQSLLSENQTNGNQVVNDYILAVGRGKIAGVSTVLKSGYNQNINVTNEPNGHVIGTGGGQQYFPNSDVNVQVVSSGAGDIGILYCTILENANSTDYTQKPINVNGTTPVNGFKAFRIHSAYFVPANPVANPYNVGTITIREQATPANVFLVMLPYRNQTNAAVYSVPTGKKAFIKSIRYTTGNSGGGASSAYVHTAIYQRNQSDKSIRARRPCIVPYGAQVVDETEAGIPFAANTDIVLMVTEANTANTKISAAFTIILEPA